MKNKIIILLFVTIVPFFIGINRVSADSCNDVSETINKYNNVVTKMEAISCNNVSDSSSTGDCVSLARSRAYYLEKLFEYNDDKTCESSELTKIVNDNKNSCSDALNSDVKKISKTMMNIFYVLAPFLFIIFGSIDLAKIVVLSDQKLAKKARSNFFKRLTAFLLIFFIPAFVNIILSLSGSRVINNLNSNNYICTIDLNKYQMTKSVAINTYNTSYVQDTKTKTKSRRSFSLKGIGNSIVNSLSGISSRNVGSTGNVKLLQAADKVHQVYEKEQWRYYDESSYSLYYSDIKSSTYNTKATCCATFISSALYEAGILSEEFINRYGYNCVSGVSSMLRDSGWVMITNVNDLIPGDVVITDNQARDNVDGHVELFAGWDTPNGLWSGAGSTNSIQSVAPSDKGDYMISRFRYAWRQP